MSGIVSDAYDAVNSNLQREGPSQQYLTSYLLLLCGAGLLWTAANRHTSHSERARLVRQLGVQLRRVERALKEMERKTFHLCGLLVPLTFQLLLQAGWGQAACARLCWAVTACGWGVDLLRVHTKWMRQNFPLKGILRDKEQHQLSGGCFFSLGCTLVISLFPAPIAITAILFLVLGDMSAALIGVAFGGEKCVVKLGRHGKKSVEGSVAMFCVCCVLGLTMFGSVRMAEYAAVVGALTATLVELGEPFGLDDNLTIPFFSGAALFWAFSRIQNCDVMDASIEWLLH